MRKIALESKIFLTALFMLMACTYLQAQVTVGSGSPPVKGALLEIKDREAGTPVSVTSAENVTTETGGLGLPRVMLVNKNTLQPFVSTTDTDWTNAAITKIKEKHAGLMVYNLSTSAGFEAGVYVWDGAQWNKQGEQASTGNGSSFPGFFYMPSFNLPLGETSDDPFFTYNPGSGTVSRIYDLYGQYESQFKNYTSIAGMTGIVPYYAKSEIDFVVTYYDATIIKPEIVLDGSLYYNVLATEVPCTSFINIVIVPKN